MAKKNWKDELAQTETPEVVETEVEVIPVTEDVKPAAKIKVVKEDLVTYQVTAANGLNVRKNPFVSAEWIGVMACDESFKVSKTDGDWGYIPEKNGWALLNFAKRA